jgi:hypothetical protein
LESDASTTQSRWFEWTRASHHTGQSDRKAVTRLRQSFPVDQARGNLPDLRHRAARAPTGRWGRRCRAVSIRRASCRGRRIRTRRREARRRRTDRARASTARCESSTSSSIYGIGLRRVTANRTSMFV